MVRKLAPAKLRLYGHTTALQPRQGGVVDRLGNEPLYRHVDGRGQPAWDTSAGNARRYSFPADEFGLPHSGVHLKYHNRCEDPVLQSLELGLDLRHHCRMQEVWIAQLILHAASESSTLNIHIVMKTSSDAFPLSNNFQGRQMKELLQRKLWRIAISVHRGKHTHQNNIL